VQVLVPNAAGLPSAYEVIFERQEPIMPTRLREAGAP
jgi:hypothetical protein